MRRTWLLLLALLLPLLAFGQNWEELDVPGTEDHSPRYVATADLDGDSDLDIFFVSYGMGTEGYLYWAENIDATAGEWAIHNIVEIPYITTCTIGAADLDGDGSTDLFLGKEDSHYAICFMNTNGDGSEWEFASKSGYGDDYTVNQLYAMDQDGDGDLDLVCANDDDTYPIAGWRNNGDDTWTRFSLVNMDYPVSDLAWGDLLNDDDMDFFIATPSPSAFWYANYLGDTMYAEYMISEIDGARHVASADFNGDGRIDFAGATAYDEETSLYVFLTGPQPGYPEFDVIQVQLPIVNNSYRDIIAGDLDLDGDMDIVSINGDDQINFHENTDGDGEQWYTSSIGYLSFAQNINLADVDGDGAVDVVGANLGSGISWLKNPGSISLNEIVVTDALAGMAHDETFVQWIFDLFRSVPAGGDAGDAYLNCQVNLGITNPSALSSVRAKLTCDELPGTEQWVDFTLDGNFWTATVQQPVGQNLYIMDIANRLESIIRAEYAADTLNVIPWPGMVNSAPRWTLDQVEATHPETGQMLVSAGVELPDYRDQLTAFADSLGQQYVPINYDYVKLVDGDGTALDNFELIVSNSYNYDNPDMALVGFQDGEWINDFGWSFKHSAAVKTDTEQLVFSLTTQHYPRIYTVDEATVQIEARHGFIRDDGTEVINSTWSDHIMTAPMVTRISGSPHVATQRLYIDADGDGEFESDREADTVVGVDEDPSVGDQAALPTSHELVSVYPNPFNPTTTVRVTLEQPGTIHARVFNLQGRRVATLANGEYGVGRHGFSLDGRMLSSGIYMLHVQAGDQVASRKLVLLK